MRSPALSERETRVDVRHGTTAMRTYGAGSITLTTRATISSIVGASSVSM